MSRSSTQHVHLLVVKDPGAKNPGRPTSIWRRVRTAAHWLRSQLTAAFATSVRCPRCRAPEKQLLIMLPRQNLLFHQATVCYCRDCGYCWDDLQEFTPW